MFFDRIRDFYDEVVVAKKTKQIGTSLFVTTVEKPRSMVFPRELLAVATQICKRF